MQVSLKLSFIIALVILLNACGFRLRGDSLLSPELQTLYISSVDQHGELTRLVKQHLTNNQVTIVKTPRVELPELRILKDKLNRRTLSVFPNGQVAEYELIYTVKYQLRIANQEPQEFSFDLYRDYQDDPDRALAKSRELSLLLNEMRRVAADKILRDMASIQTNS
ncbi:LPS-assembly lipoprotein LptE [Colwellia sp. MEBiC06753]